MVDGSGETSSEVRRVFMFTNAPVSAPVSASASVPAAESRQRRLVRL